MLSLDILPSKLSSIWAVRLGLAVPFFVYISGYSAVRNDRYFSAFVILAIFAATYTPKSYYDTVKIYAPIIFGNSARAILLILTAFVTAVVGLLINEEVLPGFARLLRSSNVPSFWFVVALFFLIVSNIKPFATTTSIHQPGQPNARAKSGDSPPKPRFPPTSKDTIQ